jgi:hypothetical protein
MYTPTWDTWASCMPEAVRKRMPAIVDNHRLMVHLCIVQAI